mmetsp:Transcript_17535/g.41176  ORF Transcript_17535/g.41176 Transcript_17535/m.41176 type:complete len:262 (+) Transcript_17535:424-1209(+)
MVLDAFLSGCGCRPLLLLRCGTNVALQVRLTIQEHLQGLRQPRRRFYARHHDHLVPLGTSRVDPIHHNGCCAGDHDVPPWLPDDNPVLHVAPPRREVLRLDGRLCRHPLDRDDHRRSLHFSWPGGNANQRGFAAHEPRLLPWAAPERPRRGQVQQSRLWRHWSEMRRRRRVVWHPAKRDSAVLDHCHCHTLRHCVGCVGYEQRDCEPIALQFRLGHVPPAVCPLPRGDLVHLGHTRANHRLLHVVHSQSRLLDRCLGAFGS